MHILPRPMGRYFSQLFRRSHILILTVLWTAGWLLPLPTVAALQPAVDVVVEPAGEDGGRALQAAIDAAPDGREKPYVIYLKAGRYGGQILVPSAKRHLHFLGEDAHKSIITYELNVYAKEQARHPRYPGISAIVLADDFRAENVTFENTAGDQGQALALRVNADRASFFHCRFLGWQDTVMLNQGRQYFAECFIEGRVDFIYGSGTAVFEKCRIHSKNGGYITAASTPAEKPFGFVFFECQLTGDPRPWTHPESGQPVKPSRTPLTALGRPWRPSASVAFVRCELGDHINPAGWDNWRQPDREKTARFAEYRNTGPGAHTEQRVPWSRQWTDAEAEKISPASILAGSDGWNPGVKDRAETSKKSLCEKTSPSEPAWNLEPTGFASVPGHGRTTTTGGAGGPVVVVDQLADLEQHAASAGPKVILIRGTIQKFPFGGPVRVSSDKTIVGLGDDATLLHGEFQITDASNVILRNLTIRDSGNPPDDTFKGKDYDGIQIDRSHHVWIDHCRIARAMDGLIDLRKNSDYITVSWCALEQANKAFGIGWTPQAETLHITIHHVKICDTVQRNPSFDNGTGHLYNNWLQNIRSYGNYARGKTHMVVENSVFENVHNPLTMDEAASLVARGNEFIECQGKQATGGSAFTPESYYHYQLDPTENVRELLANFAGPRAAVGALYQP